MGFRNKSLAAVLLVVVLTAPPPFSSIAFGGDSKASGKAVKNAPLFSLPTIDGKKIALSKVLRRQDVKAVVLSFFATWCASCRKEISHLESLQKKYKNDGLVLLLVAVDKNDKKNDIEEFLSHVKTKPPVLIDRFSILPRRYDTDGKLPALFLIDKRKTIRLRSLSFDEKTIPRLEKAVRAALK